VPSWGGGGQPAGRGAFWPRPPSANRGVRPPPITGPVQARPELQQILARSSTLASKDGIGVVSNGETVILQGSVGSEFDRRMAEALLRMEPGVRQIRNELVTKAP